MSTAAAPSDSLHNVDDDAIIAATREWATRVPMGLGLCPWAVKSHGRGLLRVASCRCEGPAAAAEFVEGEIEVLTRDGSPPLSTTLVVCPSIKAFEDFATFDDFVRNGIKEYIHNADLLEKVTLVAFHPHFLRWRGLPDDIGVGSAVQSHWGTIGQKSQQTAAATIIETNNMAFGLRKVKVRFHDTPQGLSSRECFVPTDWIVGESDGEALPDNFMHQAPYLTIHIIVNEDLASLRMCDVSRVKRVNAKRMSDLGWEGLERRMKR